MCPLFCTVLTTKSVSLKPYVLLISETVLQKKIFSCRGSEPQCRKQLDVELITASRREFISNPMRESLIGFKLCLKSFRPRITGNLILSDCKKGCFHAHDLWHPHVDLARGPRPNTVLKVLSLFFFSFFCLSILSDKNIPGNSALFALIHRGAVISF